MSVTQIRKSTQDETYDPQDETDELIARLAWQNANGITPFHKSPQDETYELIARVAWQNANGITPFHKKVVGTRVSNPDSKLFNGEFRKIYWKIGREEFPEKVLMIQEIRDTQLGFLNIQFSDKTKSYTKSKLLNQIKKSN
jgi:hypothetical protein